MALFDYRKKVSIDFDVDAYNKMYDTIQDAKQKGVKLSNSGIINDMASACLHLSPDVKKKLFAFCRDNEIKMIEQFHNGTYAVGEYDSYEYARKLNDWKRLMEFFNDNFTNDDLYTEHPMRKIALKSGFCLIPSDWIILDTIFGTPEECMYVGVVECRGSYRHGLNGNPVPHFCFFSKIEHARDYNDAMEALIYDACSKKYPDFKRLFNMQPGDENFGDLSDPKEMERAKKYLDAPQFAIFSVPEKYDPIYWNPFTHEGTPPAGAMIVRPDSETKRFR